ncbi:hypothetical protein ALT717_210005 [Alteromonas macleodii]
MLRTPLYLYRIKNSKNYYFRIRKNLVFQKLSYLTLDSSHFVASLKTSKFDEAMWLAQFIVKRLKGRSEHGKRRTVCSIFNLCCVRHDGQL